MLPLAMLLLAVAVDAGRWLDASHRLQRAVSDAVRYGAVRDLARGTYPAADQVRARVLEVLPPGLRSAEVRVSTDAKVGEEPAVSVHAECPFATFTPGLTGISSLRLVAEGWFPRR